MNYDYQPSFESDPSMQPLNPPPTAQNGKGFATASLVFGIISLVFLCCCGINMIAAILAVIFAFVARFKAGKMPTMAKVGLILAIIAIVLFAFFYGIYIYAVNDVINHPDGELARKLDLFLRQYTGKSWSELLSEAENGVAAQS